MSKRWKTRQRNAAKLERSREVIEQFRANVAALLLKLDQSHPTKAKP